MESISANNSKIFDISLFEQSTFDGQYERISKNADNTKSPKLIDLKFVKPKVVDNNKNFSIKYPYRRWKKKSKISMALGTFKDFINIDSFIEHCTWEEPTSINREENNKSVLLPIGKPKVTLNIGSKENMLNFKVKQNLLSPQRRSLLQLMEMEKSYGNYYDERIARKNYLVRQLSKKL